MKLAGNSRKHGEGFSAVAFSLLCFVASAEPVRVSSFGFDQDDSTRFLQAALDSDASEIVVDKMPSAWVTAPLKGSSNKRIVFDDGVELVAKKGAFLGGGDHLMDFINCSNVTLSGRAVLRMHKADYQKQPYAKSEHRHALNFYGSRNVTIEGLTIAESGGDGIYLGQGNGPCRNFVLRDVTCTNNRRQAISVISVDGLLIERCTFKDTKGTPPSAGIDFEPNKGNQYVCNVTLRDSVFENNDGCGIEFHLMHLDAKSPPISVVIENCRSAGNRVAFKFACAGAPSAGALQGSVVCRNCELDGSAGAPFTLMKKMEGSVDLSFENCRWREKGMPALRPLKDSDWRAKVSSPVFIGGTTQILPVKTDLAKARIVDEKPGELVKFNPVATRYGGNYTVYADRARTVRLVMRTDRILSKFDYPSGDAIVSKAGKEVARFPLPGTAAKEVSFSVPEAGFYSVKVSAGVGGIVEISGSDAPIAFDADGKKSLFKPCCKLLFELQDANALAALVVSGGGPNEMVRARIVAPSGAAVWEKDGIGAVHRFQFARPRETGLWTLELGKSGKGTFEDAGASVVGAPGSMFPCREKRWSWLVVSR
ncbi:MAG: right-handed parallel beta-helix repeat-containing protein [Kiritimatiellae bacterium]|nr:right-handed parallel beta-helix repeat-containing protein [Kiritimatiellia bacterium]